MKHWVFRMQQDIFAREAYLYTSSYINLCLGWLVTRVLRGIGIATQGGVTHVWSCVHKLYPCESSFVVQWKLDLHVVVRTAPMDHGSGSWSGNDTTK